MPVVRKVRRARRRVDRATAVARAVLIDARRHLVSTDCANALGRLMVSILIPCYNAERWIAQAIESALQQGSEHEIIIVDDGSTDDSLAVIKQFGDRVRFESGPNRGGNVARNRLLDLARSEWVQY